MINIKPHNCNLQQASLKISLLLQPELQFR
ncbi:unnamed protein product, partial [Allacma fusca]